MMKKILLLIIVATTALSCSLCAKTGKRWSAEKATRWYANQGWIVGCNYVTATAINQIEMWQEETFDPQTIDRELGLAEGLGFNTIRVFLSHLVYLDNPQTFKKRFDHFLQLCEKHHIRVEVTFWTNGGKCQHPKLGKQPESQYGVHNSQWCMVPGTEWVNDPSKWHLLKRMVQDMLRTYKEDKRILMWCLYNEPENHRRGVTDSVPLLAATFQWAREVNPSQPLTSPIWSWVGNNITSLPEVSFVLENSDIITFHAYDTPSSLERYIKQLLPYKRPMVCTEFLARQMGSTFEGSYPIFKKYHIGALSFGLTAGKCNFHFYWNKEDEHGNSIPWTEEPQTWFHDIFRPNGTPWSEAEVEFIRQATKDANQSNKIIR